MSLSDTWNSEPEGLVYDIPSGLLTCNLASASDVNRQQAASLLATETGICAIGQDTLIVRLACDHAASENEILPNSHDFPQQQELSKKQEIPQQQELSKKQELLQQQELPKIQELLQQQGSPKKQNFLQNCTLILRWWDENRKEYCSQQFPNSEFNHKLIDHDENQSEFQLRMSGTSARRKFREIYDFVTGQYFRYISLRLNSEGAEYSGELVGYPWESDDDLDENYVKFYERQTSDLRKSAISQKMQKIAKQFEIAFSLENHFMYRRFLTHDLTPAAAWPFAVRQVNRIYIGNSWCALQFPGEKLLFELLETCRKRGYAVTVIFPLLSAGQEQERQHLLEKFADESVHYLSPEVVVNDFGTLYLASPYRNYYRIRTGLLMEKRRRDPRMKYLFQKQNGTESGQVFENAETGFEHCPEHQKTEFVQRPEKTENSFGQLDQPLLRKLLLDYGVTGMEISAGSILSGTGDGKLYIDGGGILPGAENEKLPMYVTDGVLCADAFEKTLHFPVYQTNTGQYCTLRAMAEHGSRAAQSCSRSCPGYCGRYTVSYPRHLNMFGAYNSVFSVDNELPANPELLKTYADAGVKRLVFNLPAPDVLRQDSAGNRESTMAVNAAGNHGRSLAVNDAGNHGRSLAVNDAGNRGRLLAVDSAGIHESPVGVRPVKNSLKITSGLGHFTDFEELADAGTDEIFCGFVPVDWQLHFPNAPLNRREVRFVHVQAGTYEDMKILKRMSDSRGVPVTVAFNSLYYMKEQLPFVAKYIRELGKLGFQDFIVADIGLLLYLRQERIPCRIHVSGELGEWNQATIKMLFELFPEQSGGLMPGQSMRTESCHHGRIQPGPVISRIIFHRKMTTAQMESCMKVIRSHPGCSAEAFVFNEMCHYTGGFCNSLHCDELPHLCLIPYKMTEIRGWENGPDGESDQQLSGSDEPAGGPDYDWDACGASGCGLCALWKFKQIGIEYLKVVGRGKAADGMAEDIGRVRLALEILNHSSSENEFVGKIKHLQSKACGANCYYREYC